MVWTGADLRVPFQSIRYDRERTPALRLHVSQPFRRDIFLQERGDAGVEVGAEGAERGGTAIVEGSRVDRGVDGGWDASLCHFETGSEQAQSIKQGVCGSSTPADRGYICCTRYGAVSPAGTSNGGLLSRLGLEWASYSGMTVGSLLLPPNGCQHQARGLGGDCGEVRGRYKILGGHKELRVYNYSCGDFNPPPLLSTK